MEDVINQSLRAKAGDAAQSITQVGFCVECDGGTERLHVNVRRSVSLGPRSQYFIAAGSDPVTSDTWDSSAKPMQRTTLVCIVSVRALFRSCVPNPHPSLCLGMTAGIISRDCEHEQTFVMLQTDLRKSLSSHGINLDALSCCVVNQSCLAINATSAVRLLEALERLMGTWPLKAQINMIQTQAQAANADIAQLQVTAADLATRRLQLRPYIEQLLRYNAQIDALHSLRSDAILTFKPELLQCQEQLLRKVRTVC
jgi:hypothetical protein